MAMMVSEFRLARPFVPGSVHEHSPAATLVMERGTARAKGNESLPGIDEFLETSPPNRPAPVVGPAGGYSPYSAEDPEELPPVEHFLDPLPQVAVFAPDMEGALMDEALAGAGFASTDRATPGTNETAWMDDDWQQYDWRAAAALGDGREAEASNEWAATDWEVGGASPRIPTTTAAEAIASVLDSIARRIREGDLNVPPAGALTDPAAIAATLAALLGVRP